MNRYSVTGPERVAKPLLFEKKLDHFDPASENDIGDRAFVGRNFLLAFSFNVFSALIETTQIIVQGSFYDVGCQHQKTNLSGGAEIDPALRSKPDIGPVIEEYSKFSIQEDRVPAYVFQFASLDDDLV